MFVEPTANQLDERVYKPVLIDKNIPVWTSFEELCLQFHKWLDLGQRNFSDFYIFHVKDKEHALDFSGDHHVYFDPLEPEGEVVIDILCAGFHLFGDFFDEFVYVNVKDWLVAELSYSTNNTNGSSIDIFTQLLWVRWEVVVLDCFKVVVSVLEDFHIWSSWLVKAIKVHKLEPES